MFVAQCCCQPVVDPGTEDPSEHKPSLTVEESLAALRSYPATYARSYEEEPAEPTEPAPTAFISVTDLRKAADGTPAVDCEQLSTATREPTCSPSMSDAATDCPDNILLEWPSTGKLDRTMDAQKRDRINRLRCFLATSGFNGVNAPRKTGLTGLSRGVTYPLHAAVRANNIEAVSSLLWAGADRARRDSQGRSPLELAKQLSRGDSHAQVMKLLSA